MNWKWWICTLQCGCCKIGETQYTGAQQYLDKHACKEMFWFQRNISWLPFASLFISTETNIWGLCTLQELVYIPYMQLCSFETDDIGDKWSPVPCIYWVLTAFSSREVLPLWYEQFAWTGGLGNLHKQLFIQMWIQKILEENEAARRASTKILSWDKWSFHMHSDVASYKSRYAEVPRQDLCFNCKSRQRNDLTWFDSDSWKYCSWSHPEQLQSPSALNLAFAINVLEEKWLFP